MLNLVVTGKDPRNGGGESIGMFSIDSSRLLGSVAV